jgi:hypothetical protein
MMLIEVPDTIEMRSVIVDKKKRLEGIMLATSGMGKVGDCCSASLLRYKKLYEIAIKVGGKTDGIKRCRGYRLFDRRVDEPSYHYWVENNGMVYDETCGQVNIYKKREDFYALLKITDIDYSSLYCFFDDTKFSDNENERVIHLINTSQYALFKVIDLSVKANT